MKNINPNSSSTYIYFILIFFLLISSCNKKDEFAKYEIFNQSDYSIFISVYDSQTKNIESRISISHKNDFWESEKYTISKRYHFPVVDFALGGDSVKVVFSNTRQILNVSKISPQFEENSNILNPNNYELIKIGDTEVYRFTFTNEDYNNAEEIGGG